MPLFGNEWRERGYGLCLCMYTYIWAGPEKEPMMVSEITKIMVDCHREWHLKGICIRYILKSLLLVNFHPRSLLNSLRRFDIYIVRPAGFCQAFPDLNRTPIDAERVNRKSKAYS
jgi:hypothetical protein